MHSATGSIPTTTPAVELVVTLTDPNPNDTNKATPAVELHWDIDNISTTTTDLHCGTDISTSTTAVELHYDTDNINTTTPTVVMHWDSDNISTTTAAADLHCDTDNINTTTMQWSCTCTQYTVTLAIPALQHQQWCCIVTLQHLHNHSISQYAL
jgi:hypothetical protein